MPPREPGDAQQGIQGMLPRESKGCSHGSWGTDVISNGYSNLWPQSCLQKDFHRAVPYRKHQGSAAHRGGSASLQCHRSISCLLCASPRENHKHKKEKFGPKVHVGGQGAGCQHLPPRRQALPTQLFPTAKQEEHGTGWEANRYTPPNNSKLPSDAGRWRKQG